MVLGSLQDFSVDGRLTASTEFELYCQQNNIVIL
jgi:hypothetical protein